MILWIYVVQQIAMLLTLFFMVQSSYNQIMWSCAGTTIWDYHCANPTTLSEIALEIQKDKRGGNSVTHKLLKEIQLHDGLLNWSYWYLVDH